MLCGRNLQFLYFLSAPKAILKVIDPPLKNERHGTSLSRLPFELFFIHSIGEHEHDISHLVCFSRSHQVASKQTILSYYVRLRPGGRPTSPA